MRIGRRLYMPAGSISPPEKRRPFGQSSQRFQLRTHKVYNAVVVLLELWTAGSLYASNRIYGVLSNELGPNVGKHAEYTHFVCRWTNETIHVQLFG